MEALILRLTKIQSTFADTVQSCKKNNGLIDPGNLPQACANTHTLQVIFNVGFSIIGAICVLVVVIGGFRYIRAGSNDTIVAESKRQISHALVGLIVAASASVIVNFVLLRASH
jgi:hypothetical protein